MPIEYRKPTANNNPGGWTTPENAYDGAGYPETANAATITSPTDADPSLELYAFSSAGQTYSALVLKVHLASSGHSDDQFAVQYSTNGGTNWSDFSGLVLGVHNISPATTYSATLSASQDLTQVRVKVVADRVKGGDGGTISFYDCWTEGTYTGGSTFDEATTLAMDAGVSGGAALVIDASLALEMNAAQSQGEIADLLASLNLGVNVQAVLAAVAVMSASLALQSSMGQAHDGGASFDESASFGVSFGVSENAGLDLTGDVSFDADFVESQEASGDLGGTVSLGSGFTLSPAAAADLIASLSLNIQTEMTLGAAMILSAAISLNTAKGWVTEGVKAGNTYEEAMSLGMVASMTQALQLIIQSGVDFGISTGISESAQLDVAGDVGLGMDAGISIDSQLIGEDSISFDATFAKALSAAWAGDVSIALGMIASMIAEGEIPTAVTAARRLFQAIARKRDFKADPRGRDFKPNDRGRDFKGRKIN